MKATGKRYWLIAIGCLGVLAGAGWYLLFPRTHDPYTFLDGRSVVDVTVFAQRCWPATEVRVYTWEEPWLDVAKRARQELPSYGLSEVERHQESDSAVWTSQLIEVSLHGTNAERIVSVHRGRFMPPSSGADLTDGDSEWVTVRVRNFMEYSWIVGVRTSLFEPDWHE